MSPTNHDTTLPLDLDPRYVEARRVLLDALEALAPHGKAFIVVGAQAVYLRTGNADAYLVANAEASGVEAVASFDRAIERVTTVRRIEPG